MSTTRQSAGLRITLLQRRRTRSRINNACVAVLKVSSHHGNGCNRCASLPPLVASSPAIFAAGLADTTLLLLTRPPTQGRSSGDPSDEVRPRLRKPLITAPARPQGMLFHSVIRHASSSQCSTMVRVARRTHSHRWRLRRPWVARTSNASCITSVELKNTLPAQGLKARSTAEIRPWPQMLLYCLLDPLTMVWKFIVWV